MTLQTAEDLAMVLPVPVKSGSGEGDVRFIDLKDYPDFFRHLQMGFEPRSNTLSEITYAGRATGDKKLKVVEVGDFEASFVPTVSDFSRLDERFRLPAGTWDQLPEYRAYGFAVFKLKRGLARVHPMAFSYPRENPARLFFPTVHIHDGKVHKTAKFDHALFCQPGDSEHLALGGWNESSRLAGQFMDSKRAKGLIDEKQHCYLRALAGKLPNRDVIVQGIALR